LVELASGAARQSDTGEILKVKELDAKPAFSPDISG